MIDKVYVLIEGGFDDPTIAGVYAKEESAEKERERLVKLNKRSCWGAGVEECKVIQD